MSVKKWVVSNQKAILVTLCAIVVLTSVSSTVSWQVSAKLEQKNTFFYFKQTFGTIAIIRFVKNKKTVGASAFLPGILSVLAGVIGIAAGFKSNRWLIAIVSFVLTVDYQS